MQNNIGIELYNDRVKARKAMPETVKKLSSIIHNSKRTRHVVVKEKRIEIIALSLFIGLTMGIVPGAFILPILMTNYVGSKFVVTFVIAYLLIELGIIYCVFRYSTIEDEMDSIKADKNLVELVSQAFPDAIKMAEEYSSSDDEIKGAIEAVYKDRYNGRWTLEYNDSIWKSRKAMEEEAKAVTARHERAKSFVEARF